ncbi:DUF5711 family protein [uncultured Oscillibacter sp.]|uniref:DUF5711 family protein n=1 Tax=uncultured Oscillibacter sp. TaxID=876091 RepID=UPI0025E29A06|nr:DUF5711 family protein [uncultured Oscillibacter sp.]
MANRTKGIWKDGGGAGKAERSSGPLRRFLVFFLALAAVLGVVMAAAYRDGTGFDVLRRYLNYGGSASSGEERYRYDFSPGNRFAVLGDQLVVLSENSLRLLNRDGGVTWSAQVKMSAPALSQGGGRVAAYDIGGRSLYVLDERGEVFHLETEEDEPIISATLNGKGMLAVAAERRNAKGAVYAYGADMTRIFDLTSGERFVAEARISDDGNTLAAVRLGQEDGVFISSVVLYDLREAGEKTPIADYSIPNGLVLSTGEQRGRLVTVSDTCVTCASYSGRVEGSYDCGSSYLRAYSLGDEFTALLLNRYQAGNVGRLVTVDAEGAELGSLEIHEEVRSLSAAGRYLAVLYTDRLVVYNENLQVYASLRGITGVSSAVMRPDGSALLFSTESASQFLP